MQDLVAPDHDRELAVETRRERPHHEVGAVGGLAHGDRRQDGAAQPRLHQPLDRLDAAQRHLGLELGAALKEPLIGDHPRVAAGLEHDDRQAGHDRGGDPAGQRHAIARGHRHELVVQQGRHVEAAAARGQCHQADIQRVVLHALHDVRGVAGGDRDLQLRQAAAKVAQQRRQAEDRRRGAGAETHAPHLAAPESRQRLEQRRHRAVDPGCMVQKFAARRRRHRAAAHPLQQANAQALLELADLLADRRLGQVELGGRGREGAQPHDLGEGMDMIEIEAAHPKFLLMLFIR